MFDQLIDGVRKASESSLQMQQEMFKNFTRLFSGQAGEAGAPAEWGKASQKRWAELCVEMLNRHRESLDTAYKTGIQIIEQSFHVTEAKSPDDYAPDDRGALAQAVRPAEGAVGEPVPRLPDVLREVGGAGPRCSRLACSGSTGGVAPPRSAWANLEAWRRSNDPRRLRNAVAR